MDPLTGRPTDDLDPEAISLISALDSSATKVSEIIKSQDPLVSKAIQTSIENANKEAISNAQKVCSIKIMFRSINCDMIAGPEMENSKRRFFSARRRTRYVTVFEHSYLCYPT